MKIIFRAIGKPVLIRSYIHIDPYRGIASVFRTEPPRDMDVIEIPLTEINDIVD